MWSTAAVRHPWRRNITSAGTITINPSGTLGFWDTSNSLSWAVVLNGGQILDGTGAVNTISGPVTLAAASTIYMADGSGLIISGVISGTGTLTKTGGNWLTLSGSNTFTSTPAFNYGPVLLSSPVGTSIPGNLTLNNAAVCVGSSNNQFGPTSVISFSTTQIGSYYNTFELDGYNQTVAGLSGGRLDGTAAISKTHRPWPRPAALPRY